ncbi:PC4-domain-containing protein [Pyrenochaeta sp. DS3sAY3a]|nr:PC4-domain-containing protein [Pyrenochaeta sp. DS3sAY3a]
MSGFKRASGVAKKSFSKKRASPSDDEDAPRANKKAKGNEDEESTPFVPTLQEDDEGDAFVGLNAGGKRRVTISDFKKNTLVHIREYYTDDSGKLRPGKKGISLTIDQYNALLAAAPLLESALAKKGINVARPDYDAETEEGAPTSTKVESEDDD